MGEIIVSAKLPYVPAAGLIDRLVEKISQARTPDRFTIDFLETRLGMTGGSAKALIPLLKRIGFLNPDGTPTELYRKFRNESTRGWAMAEAIKRGYSELFDINEYAADLDRNKLMALVNEVTGMSKDSRSDQQIVSTFLTLRKYANFDADALSPTEKVADEQAEADAQISGLPAAIPDMTSYGLNLAYTINLNLPETTDPEVYSAIFRALKDNLLKGK